MKNNNNGIFIISLDFELFWGVLEKYNLNEKKELFNDTLNVIPKILDLFKKYNIEATWATVGMLFFRNMDELINDLPENIPNYENQKLSPYYYINHVYDKKYNGFHFAPQLIKQIKDTKGQEIGSHTFSHYYCLEKGQDKNTFEYDLLKQKEIAQKNKITMESLVYPRNQHNKDYDEICLKNGIKIIRTNPDVWFWNPKIKNTIFKRGVRFIDAYINIIKTYYGYSRINSEGLVKLPASRFFRPVSKYSLLNKLKINRIKNEIKSAAKNKMIYHLWWHPHNFGNKPEQSLMELEMILQHFDKMRNEHNMKSLNMQNVYKYLKDIKDERKNI